MSCLASAEAGEDAQRSPHKPGYLGMPELKKKKKFGCQPVTVLAEDGVTGAMRGGRKMNGQLSHPETSWWEQKSMLPADLNVALCKRCPWLWRER